MDSYDSGNLPPAESLLSRRKKRIVALSMAAFGRQLNQWLDNTPEPGQRRGKRSRDDRDRDSTAEDEHDYAAVDQRSGSGGGDARKTKKRAKREQSAAPRGNGTGTGSRKFACPFSKHDPERYKSVKTCCGPGWTDVHRVKEHIYRRHSMKGICPRCLERFENDDDLKSHQRAETPCRLVKVKAPSGFINDDQEKQLHARAKANWSEDEKWQAMYRIIFPDATKVPSAYYDTADEVATAAAAAARVESRFKDHDEYKEYVRRELPRLVKPLFEREVEKLFQSVQDTMAEKAVEIFHSVQSRFLRTWQFQSEQSASASASSTPASEHQQQQEETQQEQDELLAGLKSPSPTDLLGSGFDFIVDDPMFRELFTDEGVFNCEPFMQEVPAVEVDCGNSTTIADSAYFTSSNGDETTSSSGTTDGTLY
ncbi:hypothetical protein B0T22DRAFT_411359 [Podospora appendiculata]|uniref:C2H2-type domain-containing protein n=1 Tax=Podospora appendiculata TaxID=314037 RepID=A0AAE1C8U3_9PEZI|nr:hypothetical protein B0T22DRAFT_411359 [Podospora appendiculata]